MMQPDFGLLCVTFANSHISSYFKDFRTTYPDRAPQYQPNAAQYDYTDEHAAELPRK